MPDHHLKHLTLSLALFTIIALLIPSGLLYGQLRQTLENKVLYIPDEISRVPENNDFSNAESEYSYDRMAQTESIAVFGHKEFGENPSAGPDSTRLFDHGHLLMESERFYCFYVNELKFIKTGDSVDVDDYKVVLVIFSGESGTAYGGREESVGMMWTPPSRIRSGPYEINVTGTSLKESFVN